MKKNNIAVAIDIGTSKTTVLVADINELGELTIIGFGQAKTEGIEKGLITKPNEVIRSIKKAVEQAETTSGARISKALVNVGGYHLEFRNDADFLSFGTNQKEINEYDVYSLIEKISEKIPQDNSKVIHIIPKRFILDDEDPVIDPNGFLASKLEGEFHIVLNKLNAYSNLKRVIEATGIKVIDFIANPIASSTSVLYDEEKDMGVVVLDIGGGTTDIAVLRDGSYEYIKSIPIGGTRITLDIAHRFKIPKEDAEKLKVEYGMALIDALDKSEEIEIFPIGSDEAIIVNQYELVDTIEARLDEIFTIIKNELEETGLLYKINGGIVLTGGVSNTPYIKELASSIFDMDTRIGKPKEYKGFSDKLNYPDYATSIGIIQFKKNSYKVKEPAPIEETGSSFLEMIKQFFEKLKNLF